jgi:hypothetical protein
MLSLATWRKIWRAPRAEKGQREQGRRLAGEREFRPWQQLSKRARFGIGNRALPGGRVVPVRRRTGRPKAEHAAKAEHSEKAEAETD